MRFFLRYTFSRSTSGFSICSAVSKAFGVACVAYVAMLTACFLFAGTATAQILPVLQDTVVSRGAEFRYELRAIVPDSVWTRFPRLDSMIVVVRFSSAQLTVSGVDGGGIRAMQCPVPRLDSAFQAGALAVLRVQCGQIRRPPASSSGGVNVRDTVTLCTVRFGTLVRTDSLAQVQLESVRINASLQTLLPSRPAVVKVRDSLTLAPSFIETLEQNFPNPFETATTFAYSLAERSTVRFAVFGVGGNMLWELEPFFAARGRYTLNLDVPLTIATGVYALRLQTTNGVYWRRFMVAR
jgi:hypothetical protein